MHDAVMKTLLALIWLAQFYSLIRLVIWINRDISDSSMSLEKIDTAITVQKGIMAAILLVFLGDYLFNRISGSSRAAVFVADYALSAVIFLFIPAVFLLVMFKTRKRIRGRATGD